MSTYLQGVTDYIPQLQPFQPDLNFYQNVMQTKQTQYDQNWKSLNKMYGQYYYADLTRDDNTSKREQYLKDIDFQLKKVSQLDLSLEQNVEQATQVFKPFYEDKGLMKDMAWTKNRNNQLSKAEIFRVSTDVADRSQYWDAGVRGINYMTEEFKNATADEAMSFQNAEYVPYINVIEKANDIADKAKLNIVTTSYSPDGRYMIKTRNGEAILEPLKDLFEAQLGNDPAVQAVYRMQAYVDRKDYAASNASQFGGDLIAAEMKYLENGFNVLKAETDKRYQQTKNTVSVYDSKIEDLEKQLANGSASPRVEQDLAQYKLNRDIANKILERADEENKILNMGDSHTSVTSSGFINPYGDIKSLRYKVDNGMSAILMRKDLTEAAQVFMTKNMEQDVQADPFALLEQKKRDAISINNAREKSLNRVVANAQKIKDGTHQYDELGNVVPVLDQFYVRPDSVLSGDSTDVTNQKNQSRSVSSITKEQYLDPYMSTTFEVLDKAKREKKINNKEIAKILGYDKNMNITLDQFINKYNKYGDTWLRKYVGEKGINKIHNNMNNWINSNSNLSMFTIGGQKTELYNKYRNDDFKMNEYALYLKADGEWRKNTSKSVEQHLKRSGYKGSFLLYGEDGELRSEAEFYDALKKHGFSAGAYESIQGTVPAKASEPGAYFEGDMIVKDKVKISYPKEYDYKKMVEEAGKAYTNKNIVGKPSVVRIGSSADPGTGMSSTASTITVNPKGVSTSKAYFADAMADLNNFDWFGNKDKVTFGGIGKFNYDNAQGGSGAIGKRISEDLQKAMVDPKSGLTTFDITVSAIAAGSGNKAAIIIKPPKEFLDKYLSTSKKGETPNNLLTQQQYNMILKNGISYITDHSKMKNSMFMQAFKTPLEAYVDSHKEGYRLTNIGGDPTKSYSIVKNNLGTGDYISTVTWSIYNPIKKRWVDQTLVNNTGYQGSNLYNNMYSVLTNFFDETDVMNAINKNNR